MGTSNQNVPRQQSISSKNLVCTSITYRSEHRNEQADPWLSMFWWIDGPQILMVLVMARVWQTSKEQHTYMWTGVILFSPVNEESYIISLASYLKYNQKSWNCIQNPGYYLLTKSQETRANRNWYLVRWRVGQPDVCLVPTYNLYPPKEDSQG